MRLHYYVYLSMLLSLVACAGGKTEKETAAEKSPSQATQAPALLTPAIRRWTRSYFRGQGNEAFENTVYFDFDKSDLRPDARHTLDKQLAWFADESNTLAKAGKWVLVMAAHADVRGTPDYNIALTQRRASAAINYFKAQGLKADMMTRACGKSYQLKRTANQDDESWYQANRRTTVVIPLDRAAVSQKPLAEACQMDVPTQVLRATSH